MTDERQVVVAGVVAHRMYRLDGPDNDGSPTQQDALVKKGEDLEAPAKVNGDEREAMWASQLQEASGKVVALEKQVAEGWEPLLHTGITAHHSSCTRVRLLHFMYLDKPSLHSPRHEEALHE